MTDLEMVKKCAERMGYSSVIRKGDEVYDGLSGEKIDGIYWPLENDAQAMALVKKFGLSIMHVMHDAHSDRPWRMFVPGTRTGIISSSLNRAIVECVANLP